MQQIQSFASLAPPPANPGQVRNAAAEPGTPQRLFSQILGKALEGLTPRTPGPIAGPTAQGSPPVMLLSSLGSVPSDPRLNLSLLAPTPGNPAPTDQIAASAGQPEDTDVSPVASLQASQEAVQQETAPPTGESIQPAQVSPQDDQQLNQPATPLGSHPESLAVNLTATLSAIQPANQTDNQKASQPVNQQASQLEGHDPELELFAKRAVGAVMANQSKPGLDGKEVLANQATRIPTDVPASSLTTSDGSSRTATFQSIVSLLTGHGGEQTSSNPGSQGSGQERPSSEQVVIPPQKETPGTLTIPGLSARFGVEPTSVDQATKPEGLLHQSSRFEDAESLLRQTNRFLKLAIEGSKSELKMQLSPERLGTLVVRLTVQDGVVNAHLTARDSAVRALLDANMDQLRARLNEQGLKVESLQVSVGSDSAYHQSRREQQGLEQHFHRGSQSQGKQASSPDPNVPGKSDPPDSRIPAQYRTGVRFNGLA